MRSGKRFSFFFFTFCLLNALFLLAFVSDEFFS